MKNKKAFSLVEIIIVLAIITLLAIVGLSYQGASNQKTQNTKIIGDIGTINNSILSYLEEEKELPEPKGNKNYFGTGSEYAHDKNDSFGVHGFVTESLLPKKYLNYLPLDPRTNQYYAYGKTNNYNFYEIAGVLNINGQYQSKVEGNYPGEEGPYSLIREYNGPNFVSHDSKHSFPYNPTERLLIAQIDSFSGSVQISGNSYLISGEQVLEHTLVSGDTITVSSGGTATIFYSDGSQSVLGDENKESILTLANMEFKEEDNLLTNIQLALDSGTLWTKATNLNSEGSDFEVYTTDTAASVRGTIFGIQKDDSNDTIITVSKGQIETKKIPAGTNIVESIENETIKPILETVTNPFIETGETQNTTDETTGTPITEVVSETFSTNIIFDISEIKIDNSDIEINIPIENISKQISHVAIINDETLYLSEIDNSLETLTLTGDTKFSPIEDTFKETKIQKNSLYLEDVELLDEKDLSVIITTNSEIQLYLCKYKKNKLKCSGKQEIKIKGDSLSFEESEEEDNLSDILEAEEEEEIVIKSEYGELYASAEFDEVFGDGCATCGWGGSEENFKKNYQLFSEKGEVIGEVTGTIYTFENYAKSEQSSIKCENNSDTSWSTNDFSNPFDSLISDNFKKLTYGNNDNTCGHNLYELDGEKGVIISDGKYLKYSGLELEDDFVIEMSVRFPVDNPGGTRYLFQLGDYKLYLANNGKVKFINKDGNKVYESISIYDGIFHKITAIKEGKNYTLKIDGEILGSFYSENIIDSTSGLYIGSKDDKTSQINNIVNYIKIYK